MHLLKQQTIKASELENAQASRFCKKCHCDNKLRAESVERTYVEEFSNNLLRLER